MKTSILMWAGLAATLFVAACDNTSDSGDKSSQTPPPPPPPVVIKSLEEVLSEQSDEAKMRYDARHPKETLEFIGIKPGMVVVEILPGAGWYTKILLPYLGARGRLIGADYAAHMYPKFGFFDEKTLAEKNTWVETWKAEAETWRNRDGASLSAFQLGRMPPANDGRADVVLFIRALHNLARFENDGGFLRDALSDAFRALKPGGIVGVVQHLAPEDASDEWASGANGYLKQSFVIEQMKQAGFEFVASSDINLNPADQPNEKDIVWRLPPSLSTSKDDPELKEKYLAIGESSRMTLTFRKP